MNAETAQIRLGRGINSIDGGIDIRDRFINSTIRLEGGSGNIGVGGNIAVAGNVSVGGDITLEGADCAEEFEIALDVEAVPGMVMALDAKGKLRPSTEPYDRRVAGIVAGAGDLRPGIILGRQRDTIKRVPIALFGRVYCMVDATDAPIAVGDLLTTSSTRGSAMKATHSAMAFGAIIGKALQPLASGTGLIQVLVALQ